MGKKKQQDIDSSITDISAITDASNESISAYLKSRYDLYKIYSNIGSRHLVVLNPLKNLAINDDQTSLEYVAAYKDASGSNNQLSQISLLDPHLFDLVNKVYFHMRRTGIDQNIVLRGVSGSGKSEIRKLTIRHLVRLSSHRKESKVQTQILDSQTILTAFGECQSTINISGSRYGYYGEIQFNERGRMIGAKTLHYFLEKSRVTGHSYPSATDSNYNIFYYLLAGTSPEEKTALQITNTDPASYTYLQKYKKRFPVAEDGARFQDLKSALKSNGFRKEHVARIIQLITTILHLGNLEFVDPDTTTTQEAAYVKNPELLDTVADFLGLDPRALENVLTFKTTMIRKDFTTLILDAKQAALQRDTLCETLYSLLFSWIVERMNSKTCMEEFNSFVGILDFPGLQGSDGSSAGFDQLCVNLGNERIQHYLEQAMFVNETELFRSEGIPVPDIQLDDNCINLLTRSKGVCDTINTMTDLSKHAYTDNNIMDSLVKFNTSHPAFSTKTTDSVNRCFIINHYSNTTPVQYSTDGFIEDNNSQISVDFVSLFKGGLDVQPSWNTFIVDLFAHVKLENHPKHNSTVIAAKQSAKPMRAPSQRRSTRRKGGNNEKSEPVSTGGTVLEQINAALDELVQSFEEVKLWSIYCILPKQLSTTSTFNSKNLLDVKFVESQLAQMNMATVASLPTNQYLESYTHQEFLDRYRHLFNDLDTSRLVRAQCDMAAEIKQWNTNNMCTTQNKVFLSATAWRELEDQLRLHEKTEQRQAKEEDPFANTAAAAGLPLPSQQYLQDDQHSFYSEDESGQLVDHGSYYGSESYAYSTGGSDIKNELNLYAAPQGAPIEENLDATEEDESKMSGSRKRWLYFVYAITWWIPSKFMIWCGRMKRKDIRVAWREKFTLCFLIFLMCAFVIWFLVFFGDIVCPKQNVFSTSELQSHGKDSNTAYVSIRGEVFDLTSFAPHHYPSTLVSTSAIMEYGGTDVSALFPVQVSALCQAADGSQISPYVSFDYTQNYTDINAQYHDFRYSSDDYNPNWYYDQMSLLRQNYKVGNMGYEMKAISDQSKTATTINGINTLRIWAVIDHRIYDLTSYTLGGRYLSGPEGEAIPATNTDFMAQEVVTLFQQKSGQDITQDFYALGLDTASLERELVCLRNLFYVGQLDSRNSPKCRFSYYLLLIVTVAMCAVVVFKFVAAIRIGGKRVPEEHDKFVICQVTCYTEDEESLRKTIDSLSRLDYDDKRKLIFVICDGMIVGSGNDLPTPRIVLNIFGVDPQVDPEPLSFVSVGDGMKQHNMGKIYSGLYEVSGHVVPYIVVVKCGHPRERQKPGNRGKRDSQLILMQYLNRVFYDAPMNPLQLEIYHQMKNVIGVSPEFYEFVLMVDADTEVMRDGLNHLVSSTVLDSKIIGICGETTLANEKDSWVTMIQVYEYFISHHLIKSFESLFATVSCLPGCFTMYRIRSVDGKKALFMSNEIIEDYSINNVDTLHKKNLLHLGEDRYLTTLLLKHFPNFKTKFNPDAHCKTNAPDTWSILVSQRRRWINSTVHNLGELVFLPRLCGFCCFSMRFIVMLDLISTLVMPAILGYLGYLIYTLATIDSTIPYITILTIAATYGLQAVLFIIMGRWEFIGWMIVSLLATPVFSFWIPIYSYWHFDDFSWGNTRVVVGDKGKKVAVSADEGTFDPKSIPTMKWSQYEQQVLQEDYYSDNMSHSSGYTQNSYRSGSSRLMMHPAGPGSVYGQSHMMASQDNLSAYAPTRMSNTYDLQSTGMPSSVSMPLMGYNNNNNVINSNRSMASFAPAQSPFQSQPGQYIPMQHSSQFNSSQSLMMDGLSVGGEGPTNEEIATQVQRILETADLNQVTKKQVREELQSIFGVSMNSRKDFINACIEDILQSRS